jgi:MarR family transcriptional regulator, lower aerobic nicotinate degradation pathway regulator
MSDPNGTGDAAPAIELEALPGNAIRRLQQIAVAIFLQEAEPHGVTPVQYAVLQALANMPGIDQRSLARSIGFDTSTIASVVDRLEGRALVRRGLDPADRRVRLLSLTAAGHALLVAVQPAMRRAQARMLAPLTPAQQELFMGMLQTLVAANNGESRAPSDG